jgi:hypothetical protein
VEAAQALSANSRRLRTLVVAPNWVGDCVMAEPVFRALAASGREISVLARRPLHSLLALFPGLDRTDATLAKGDDDATLAALVAGGFDEAMILPNSFRAAWLMSRAGIARRFGYRADLRGPLLAPAVARPRGRRPQIEDYRELLGAMGVAPPSDWIPRLDLPEALRERGRERIARAGLGPVRAAARSSDSHRGPNGGTRSAGRCVTGPTWRGSSANACPAPAKRSSSARKRSGSACACTRRAAGSTRFSGPTSTSQASRQRWPSSISW